MIKAGTGELELAKRGNAETLALLKQLKEQDDNLKDVDGKINNLTNAINSINARVYSMYRVGVQEYTFSIEKNSVSLIACQHDGGGNNHLIAVLICGMVYQLSESGNVFKITWLNETGTFKIKSTAPYYAIGIISTNNVTLVS